MDRGIWENINRWREEDRQREKREEEARRQEERRRRQERQEEARRQHLEAGAARLIVAALVLGLMLAIAAPVWGLFWPAVFASAVWFLAEATSFLFLRKKGGEEEILEEEGEILEVEEEEGPHPQMHEDFYFEPEERLEEYGDEAGP